MIGLNVKLDRFKGKEKLKVGSKLYYHDYNCRHYTHDDGTKSSSPIFSKSFREVEIDRETPRSFYVGKVCINKADLTSSNAYGMTLYYASREGVDAAIWREANLHRLLKKLEGANIELLRELDGKVVEEK